LKKELMEKSSHVDAQNSKISELLQQNQTSVIVVFVIVVVVVVVVWIVVVAEAIATVVGLLSGSFPMFITSPIHFGQFLHFLRR